ncbi:hypothetical protein KSP39_PZI014107 [Platanthera zijinensis]|uniref:Uncharacterized protein n=1 Tax=Platanthera zijinensis TaxID=2320716 RepID=A0AAP0G317_9ASPA
MNLRVDCVHPWHDFALEIRSVSGLGTVGEAKVVTVNLTLKTSSSVFLFGFELRWTFFQEENVELSFLVWLRAPFDVFPGGKRRAQFSGLASSSVRRFFRRKTSSSVFWFGFELRSTFFQEENVELSFLVWLRAPFDAFPGGKRRAQLLLSFELRSMLFQEEKRQALFVLSFVLRSTLFLERKRRAQLMFGSDLDVFPGGKTTSSLDVFPGGKTSSSARRFSRRENVELRSTLFPERKRRAPLDAFPGGQRRAQLLFSLVLRSTLFREEKRRAQLLFGSLLKKMLACQIAKTASPVEHLCLALQQASFGSAVAGRSGGWKRSVRTGGGRWLLQTELFGGVSQGGRVETEQTPLEVHLFFLLPAAFAQNGATKRPNKLSLDMFLACSSS